MNRYVYTDHMKGGPVMDWSSRRKVEYPRVVTGQAIGRESFGKPFPVFNGEVIFECEAEDILAADAALLAATGIVAARVAHVSCNVRPL